jgi:hypothetical protein
MIGVFLAAAAQAGAAPPSPMAPLQLTCVGAGTANKTISEKVESKSRLPAPPGQLSQDKTETKTISRKIQQEFADQVDVRLFSGDDRIRMPRAMLPELHGGSGGWFKLKNVTGDQRTIQAKIAVAFLVSPKLFIDRVTGIISISGDIGDYSGQCEVYDPNARPRF